LLQLQELVVCLLSSVGRQLGGLVRQLRETIVRETVWSSPVCRRSRCLCYCLL